MKKYSFLLIFLIGFSILSDAQTTNEQTANAKQTISGIYLFGGVAFPTLDLGKGDPTNNSSGMAALGFHVELGYTKEVTNHFGYKIASFYYGNEYSKKKYNQYYSNRQTFIGETHLVTSKDNWSVGGLLLKPYYYIPVTENLTWEVYGSVGMAAFYTPQYTTITKTNAGQISNTTETYWDRSKGVSFSYGLGTQLNFTLFNANLLISSDYLVSPISYTKTGTDSNNKTYSDKVKSTLGYFTLNLGYIVYF